MEALYYANEQGRLTYIREPGYPESELPEAPRFSLSRTANKAIWRFRHDLPDELCRSLSALCAAQQTTADWSVPIPNLDKIRAILQAHRPIERESGGPAYWIPPQQNLSPQAHTISTGNSELLSTHFSWSVEPRVNFADAPVVATVVDGVAVALGFCARITAAAAEAGVVTEERFRGRGFAGLAVAKWAEQVRAKGIIPLYSTSWENKASQAVAAKLNCINYAENWSIY